MPTQLTNHGALFVVLCKQAGALPHDAYQGHALQSWLPVQKARQLSAEEEAEIAEAQNKILPRIFKSEADPISEDMASPWLLGGATSGALAGGAVGTLLGRLIDAGRDKDDAWATGLGLLLGGVGGGGLGYIKRKRKNETLRDRMRRLPEGATRRDMMSDPVYQREIDRRMLREYADSDKGLISGAAGGLAASLFR